MECHAKVMTVGDDQARAENLMCTLYVLHIRTLLTHLSGPEVSVRVCVSIVCVVIHIGHRELLLQC